MIPDLSPLTLQERAWRRLAADCKLPDEARPGLENSLLMQRYCVAIACEDLGLALRRAQPFKAILALRDYLAGVR